MRTLDTLLTHPDVTGIERDVVSCCTGTKYHHAAAFDDQTGNWKCLFAGMFEHHVDIAPLADDFPNCFSEPSRFLKPGVVLRRTYFRHRAPAMEFAAVDQPFCAEREHELALGFVGDNADRIGAGNGAELCRERTKAAARAPDEHIVSGPEHMRPVAKKHPVGGCERKRVTGRFLPREMPRPFHELAVLHACELCKGTIRCLIAPDSLRGRKHRIAPVAFFIIAVVLIAMHNNFVTDFPTIDLRPNRPDNSRGVGTGHVVRVGVYIHG